MYSGPRSVRRYPVRFDSYTPSFRCPSPSPTSEPRRLPALRLRSDLKSLRRSTANLRHAIFRSETIGNSGPLFHVKRPMYSCPRSVQRNSARFDSYTPSFRCPLAFSHFRAEEITGTPTAPQLKVAPSEHRRSPPRNLPGVKPSRKSGSLFHVKRTMYSGPRSVRRYPARFDSYTPSFRCPLAFSHFRAEEITGTPTAPQLKVAPSEHRRSPPRNLPGVKPSRKSGSLFHVKHHRLTLPMETD